MGIWKPNKLCAFVSLCKSTHLSTNIGFVCFMAACECDPLFHCCCSSAAVHIMSSHLLLSHSVSLFFSPLISLLFFFLLPAAHKLSWKGGAMRATQGFRLLPLHSANHKESRNAASLNIKQNTPLLELLNTLEIAVLARLYCKVR